MGDSIFRNCGFTDDDLIPVKRQMLAANNEGINILGAVFIRLSGKDKLGVEIEAAEMVYVTDSTKLFYLSRHAMEQLRIISPDFPTIGAASSTVEPEPAGVNSIESFPSSCSNPPLSVPPVQHEKHSCGCYKRALPPKR